jgi:hypothetical protein
MDLVAVKSNGDSEPTILGGVPKHLDDLDLITGIGKRTHQ